ncbi:MAG: signal peptidase II [Ruminococcaceae bacterium]|jgi:signal peptidase II|nr:signal peptidase II [Oscillospiraceae bacterium]
MVWTIIIIILSVADQLIKLVINRNLTATDRISVIEGFFYIIRRENSGAAWSFLAGRDWGIYLLIVMSLLMTALLVWLLAHIRHIGLSLCLSLIIAGSIGNLIDRVRILAVVDYLDFHFGRYVFPTFNLADMLIVIGTALLCIFLLKDNKLIDHLFPAGKNENQEEKRNRHAAKNPRH